MFNISVVPYKNQIIVTVLEDIVLDWLTSGLYECGAVIKVRNMTFEHDKSAFGSKLYIL